ncbi:MAG: hypothetical protein COB15_00375 [Flavobacteriales bacterium]|nr:MAG: hypothetical protein COB15_00375 [Flavobacteriales bacterium]
MKKVLDTNTADAFASSWNNLPTGSVYTFEQFEDWFAPLKQTDIQSKSVLELGCGNGSLLTHMTQWNPSTITGVDLGDSVLSCKKNMNLTNFENFQVLQHDLTSFESDGYDLVYSIGVLHHLKKPKEGFDALIKNTKNGGRFHGWVYAKEGNKLIIYTVEPIRKIASKLPWWLTKYFIATPLAIPFYGYGKLIKTIPFLKKIKTNLPLYDYMIWIGERGFSFFRHVAFDQLVTPQTTYLSKNEILAWLGSNHSINQESTYIIFRNGNSWKFGGKKV